MNKNVKINNPTSMIYQHRHIISYKIKRIIIV